MQSFNSTENYNLYPQYAKVQRSADVSGACKTNIKLFCGPAGPQGIPGPTGPQGSSGASSVAAIQVQCTNMQNAVIAFGQNIIFNKILSSVGSITCDPSTGIITLGTAGVFLVNWDVAVTATTSSENHLSFTLKSSQGDSIETITPLRVTESSGTGLIVANSPGVTLSLVNTLANNSSVILFNHETVQATMVIYSIG